MNKFKLVILVASSMFAITFTLSACSGDDGRNGRDGASCTINGDQLTCGETTVVLNGVGVQGPKGDDGKDGVGCTLNGNRLTCGDKTLTLNDGIGCILEQDAEGKGPATITCGANSLVIPMCKGEMYSLAKSVCDNYGELYSIVTIGTQTWMKEDLRRARGNLDNNFTWEQATAEGVCPNGWKLPSKADFEVLIAASDFANWSGTASTRWWSSTKDDATAYALYIDRRDVASISEYTVENGFAVRCIKG